MKSRKNKFVPIECGLCVTTPWLLMRNTDSRAPFQAQLIKLSEMRPKNLL